MNNSKSKTILGLSVAIALFVFAFTQRQLLNFDVFLNHYQNLIAYTQTHFLLSSIAFFSIYTLAVAFSFPGALALTLIGGILFGTFFGGTLIVLAATSGASLVFTAARYFFKESFEQKISGKLSELKKGFEKNAFNYLLFLRLTPLFPFWLVNIAPAFLNVSFKTYFLATFFGIMPGTYVFASIGAGLSAVISELKTGFTLQSLVTKDILIALTGLGLLSLLPIIIKKVFKNEV